MMSPASGFRSFVGRLLRVQVRGDCLMLTLFSKHDLFDGDGQYSHTDDVTRDYWVFPGPVMDKAKSMGLPGNPPLGFVRMSGVLSHGAEMYLLTDIELVKRV